MFLFLLLCCLHMLGRQDKTTRRMMWCATTRTFQEEQRRSCGNNKCSKREREMGLNITWGLLCENISKELRNNIQCQSRALLTRQSTLHKTQRCRMRDGEKMFSSSVFFKDIYFMILWTNVPSTDRMPFRSQALWMTSWTVEGRYSFELKIIVTCVCTYLQI